MPVQVANANSSTQGSRLNSCNSQPTKVKNLQSFDVVILGGTPSGVAAAVTASNLGLRVALLSQSPVVGGAISNGLDATDLGDITAVSGYPRYFFGLVGKFYKSNFDWRLEPKVAESIFAAELLIKEVTVRKNISIKSVKIENNQISTLSTQDGQNYCGKVFIDATYTGDLLARAGLKFHVSDSDLLSYHETQIRNPNLSLIVQLNGIKISEATKAFAHNPYIRSFANPPTFKSIYKQGMPSMTYRLCVTKKKSNKVDFARGPNYFKRSPSWKIFMKSYFNKQNPAYVSVQPNGTIETRIWQIARLPNNKYDLNSGRSSFTNVPVPLEYFDDPSQRERIEGNFAEYLQDFVHFAQNDPAVPKPERKAIRGFGLCADEFVDNHNWPYDPYIRGGQRLVGKTTLTTTDIFKTREKKDSVAIGSYRLDMKPGMFIYSQGKLFQDWATFFKAPIYEIPFGSMLPKSGVRNLITSVSISASPLAYSSMRMEVQFMALGQVAGIAASVAIKEDRVVSDGMYKRIQTGLKKDGSIFKIREICTLMAHDERVKEHFHPPTCEPHAVINYGSGH